MQKHHGDLGSKILALHGRLNFAKANNRKGLESESARPVRENGTALEESTRNFAEANDTGLESESAQPMRENGTVLEESTRRIHSVGRVGIRASGRGGAR